MRGKAKIGAYALVTLLALGVSAQPSRVPAPPQLVHGRTLVVDAANFSIEAPADDWHWEQLIPSRPAAESLGTYVAVNPQTGSYYVVTLPGGKISHFSREFERGVLAAVSEISPQAAESLRHDSRDIPVPGTLHYEYVRSYPNLGLQHTYSYTFPTGTTVTIMAITPQAQEPAEFTRFVKSVRLLKPVEPEVSAEPPLGSAPGYFGVLLLGAGIAGLVNKAKGRRVVNAFKAGTWTVLVVFIADFTLAVVLIIRNDITDPYWQGRLTGGVLASAALPLILGAVLAHRSSTAANPPQT